MRVTEKQLEVLRLAKDGDVYDDPRGGRNGGLARIVNTLRNAGYLDQGARLTIEGMRVLQENSQ